MEDCKIESGLQLLSRINQRPDDNLKFPMFPMGLDTNQIVEITGSPATGKTLLLMDFIVRCVLPTCHDGVDLPGNSKAAVLVNTDHQINLFNLISLIETTLLKSGVKSRELVESCLKNITILNCYSSEQLKFTFLNMERILHQNANVGLVAIDSLSAYYWADRLDLGVISYKAHCASILAELKDVVKDFGVVTVFTRTEAEAALKNRIQVDYSIQLKELAASSGNKYEAIVLDNDKIVSSIKYAIENFIVFSD